MFKKVIQKMLVLALIIIGVIIIVTGGLWLLGRLKAENPGPVVSIQSPAYGSEFSLGEILAINSTSSDDKQFITSVELWVIKDGTIKLENRSFAGEGSHSISITQGWQPLAQGDYRLIVRAFNNSGNSGQAAVDLKVFEQTSEEETFIMDDGLSTEAAGGFIPIQTSPNSTDPEGNDPSPSPPPPPPDPDPNPPGPGEFMAVMFDILMDAFFPVEQQGTWVEIEAVAFQVQEEYDELYCYVGLGDYPAQRVPQTDSFHVTNTYEWDLPEYLGGDNIKVVFVPDNENLDIFLDCWALGQNGSTPRWAGLYKQEHPPADWNGELIEGISSDGEGFTVSYRINPAGGPLMAPTNLHHVVLNNRVLLTWNWAGVPAEIDGYKIFRNNSYVATVPAAIYTTEVPPMWIVPPCGEEYTYNIIAYKDNVHSPYSNDLVYQSENCDGLDNIDEISLTQPCGGSAAEVKALYQYYSMHGAASIDIRAIKNGEIVSEIFSSRVQIQHGTGTAAIELTNFSTDPLQTDQLTFYMYDHTNMPFYVETIDYPIDWDAGLPDLTIPSAWVDRPNNKLNIRVRNDSCSGLAITPNLSFIRQSDGLRGFQQITSNLRPGTQKLITIDLDPGEMDLWAGEIVLTVDPLEKIEEVSDSNNFYHIDVARVKRVVFTSIDIYDDHDWIGPGEWDTYFYFCKDQCTQTEINRINKLYQWNNGSHTIYGVFFNPIISSNDALILGVYGYEADYNDYSGTPFGKVGVYHSPDGNNIPALDNAGYTHMGSWKSGGTFYIRSDADDYRIHYEIVMEYY